MPFVNPPDRGNLETYYIADVLSGLFRSQRTGSLRVERGSYLKIIYVLQGKIAYASSNAHFDSLGEVLVRSGMLTPEQLEDALARVEPKKSLGKIFVELGYLSPKELVQGARLQVHNIVDSIFQWDDGAYYFNEAPLPPQVVNLGILIPTLVVDGVSSYAKVEWLRRYIPEGQTATLMLNERFYELQPELELRPKIEEVITWCDGNLTVEEIAEKTGHNEFFVAKILAAMSLLELGKLQIRPKAVAVSMEEEEAIPPPEVAVPPPEVADEASFADLTEETEPPLTPQTERSTDSESAFSLSESVSEASLVHLPGEKEQEEPAPPVEEPPSLVLPSEEPEPPPPATEAPSVSLPGGLEPPSASYDMEQLQRVIGGTAVATPRRRARSRKGSQRFFLILLFVLVVAVAVGVLFVRFRDLIPGLGREEPVARVVPEPQTPQPEPAPVPETEATPPEEMVTLPTVSEAQPAQPAAPEEKPAQPAPPPATEKAEPVVPQQVPPAPTQEGPAGPARPDARALRNADEKQLQAMARQFRTWLARADAREWTIQVELACQVETVHKALDEVTQPEKLYILPKRYRGRSCFIVGYGIFPDRNAAERARGSELTPLLLQQPSPPQVVRVAIILRRAS